MRLNYRQGKTTVCSHWFVANVMTSSVENVASHHTTHSFFHFDWIQSQHFTDMLHKQETRSVHCVTLVLSL